MDYWHGQFLDESTESDNQYRTIQNHRANQVRQGNRIGNLEKRNAEQEKMLLKIQQLSAPTGTGDCWADLSRVNDVACGRVQL